MFLQNLNFEQQRVFLKLADEIIHADGILSAQEDQLFAELKLQLPSNIDVANELGDLNKVFKTKKTRVSVLTEIIGIGYVDGYYDAKERKYVNNLGKKLGFIQKEIDFFTQWIEKQFDSIKEITLKMED